MIKQVSLNDIGYPHYVLFEDGNLLNLIDGSIHLPQKGNEYVLWDATRTRRERINSKHLLSWMFQSPYATCYGYWANMSSLGYSKYDVTYTGAIYSRITYEYMIGSLSFDGYQRVSIVGDDGHSKTEIVHRLVAKMFIPNPDNKPEVNHIDGNKLHNSVTNLEWVWGWENVEHALKTGLRISKMSDELITDICVALQSGMRVIDIIRRFNVPKHLVLGIKSGCHNRISKNYNFARNKHF